ncbi:MAG: hypothetical protein ACUVTO_08935 [Candidatus Caldatribacteriaceae bacterium]
MEKIKVGLVHLGFFAYPKEYLEKRSQECRELLEENGFEVSFSRLVIGREAAEQCLPELKKVDMELLILHFVSWTNSPPVVHLAQNCSNLPILIWGTGGRTDPTTGSLVSPASVAGITAALFPLKALNIPHFTVIDELDQPSKIEEIQRIGRIAKAVALLRRSRIGIAGYADMGLYTAMYEGLSLKGKIGVEVEEFSLLEIVQAMEKVSPEKVALLSQKMKVDWQFEVPVGDEILTQTAKIYLALEERIQERKYSGLSIKCVEGMSKVTGFTPCVPLSLLADRVVSTCECDVPGMVTELMLKYISGGRTPTFMEHYEIHGTKVLVGVCGFAPFSWCHLPPRINRYGWGGFTGLANTSKIKVGETVTVARLASFGSSYRLFVTRAKTYTPPLWEELGWPQPAPRFPSLELEPECGIERYIQEIAAQHCLLVEGDFVQDLVYLGQLLGLEVIR